ncbi:helicase-associated domain-containing protein [Tepidibacillus decaturensis]|uniref:Helicase XPB/Ssl2 N-terminal domain-containing protein n=1 Tax=Tepidibacillus decaturensis TaxID=1413211 RepID=A0A135L4I4_9BACI|nr:helicase-associated domain-containing protein [Tepidibacillus decaturensis]KXG43924.1 hypothetical protein U473_07820 [Tepidibacillus decaturensis]
MQLGSYLEQLSPSTLKKIIEEHQIKVNSNQPNQMVEQLIKLFSNSDALREIFEKMTNLEKEVLSYFIVQIPNQIFPYRKLDKLRGTLNRNEFEYGLIKLRRKGILYTIRKSWGEVAYTIPEQLFLQWHRFLFFQNFNQQSEEQTPYTLEPSPKGDLEEDLFQFLTYIQTESVPLTQRGTVHKRHLAKLSEHFGMDETLLSKFPMNRDHLYEYPVFLQLLLVIAETMDLIEKTDQLVGTDKIEKWFTLTQGERRGLLEQLIRIQFKSSDIFLQHLFFMLFHFPEGRWYSFTSIFHRLAKRLNRPVTEEFVVRAEQEILKPLYAFGWIELGKDTDGNWLFKWLPKEKEELAQIYVQPNYELLVPKNFPYRLRAQLEQFAVLEQIDQMNRYRLTKDSILKGLEKQKSIEDILAFLERLSMIPIGDHFKQTLLDWGKNYGTISFLDVRIMVCQSEEIANTLKSLQRFKEWIIGEISPTHLIIKRERFDFLLQNLQQAGFNPNKQIWTEDRVLMGQEIEEEEETPFEVLRNKDYRIENVFPSFPFHI